MWDWEVLTARQLAQSGMTRSTIRARCRAGALRVLERGLYLRGPRLDGDGGWWQDVATAAARRPDAVLSGATAAAVHGLDGFGPGEPILLTVPHGTSCRGAGLRRVARLEPPRQLGALTVTSVGETLVDLGADLEAKPGCRAASRKLDPVDRVELALEAALRRGLTSIDELQDLLRRANNARPGRSVLRDVLRRRPADVPPTGSYLETRCVQELRRGGLPDFDRQVRLDDDRGLIGWVDLHRSGVVIETVGSEWHLDRFNPDHRRYARLTSAGYTFLPFTFSDVEHHPGHVTRSTTRALGLRSDVA